MRKVHQITAGAPRASTAPRSEPVAARFVAWPATAPAAGAAPQTARVWKRRFVFPLSCRFCRQDNPAGAKFCIECGAPMHLKSCDACSAVNDRAATRCHKCGDAFCAEPGGACAGPGRDAEPPPPLASIPDASRAGLLPATADHDSSIPLSAEVPGVARRPAHSIRLALAILLVGAASFAADAILHPPAEPEFGKRESIDGTRLQAPAADPGRRPSDPADDGGVPRPQPAAWSPGDGSVARTEPAWPPTPADSAGPARSAGPADSGGPAESTGPAGLTNAPEPNESAASAAWASARPAPERAVSTESGEPQVPALASANGPDGRAAATAGDSPASAADSTPAVAPGGSAASPSSGAAPAAAPRPSAASVRTSSSAGSARRQPTAKAQPATLKARPTAARAAQATPGPVQPRAEAQSVDASPPAAGARTESEPPERKALPSTQPPAPADADRAAPWVPPRLYQGQGSSVRADGRAPA